MSDGKKGFFSRIVENIKQEMTVNPEMKVCLYTLYTIKILKIGTP